MRCFYLVISLGVFMIAACNPLSTETARYNPEQTDYDPAVLVTPAVPAPVDGDFRQDAAARLAYEDMQRPLLVFIYDDMCGNCLAMRPYIAQLEADYWGRVDVAYLERDNLLNLGYEVFTFIHAGEPPEFFFVDTDQSVIEHWQGAPSIEELRAALDAYLQTR